MKTDKKPTVTVFGAGITGLTAAHELAVRGCSVTVIAPEINDHIYSRTFDRGIGGVARTQYFCDFLPFRSRLPDEGEDPDAQVEPDIPRLGRADDLMFDDALVFAPGTATPVSSTRAEATLAKFSALVARMNQAKMPRGSIYIVFPRYIAEGDEEAQDALLQQRRAYVQTALGLEKEEDLAQISQVRDLEVFRDPRRSWVLFGTAANVRPGEHGFRFFPSFYRHLFDTMRRTPILNPRASEVGHATVFHNLVPVEELGFARAGGATSFTLPRQPIRSFESIHSYLRLIEKELDYPLEDLARFGLKLFKYMTSCSLRRAREYEQMSWSDFLDLSQYSPVLREHLEYGPQMMAALRGSRSDARTQGNILTQLIMDQFVSEARSDATLGGPTSGAWFNHWYDFLLTQPVKFQRGELVGLSGVPGKDGGKPRLRPIVEVDGKELKVPENDYIVLAFSLDKIREMTSALEGAARQAEITLPPDNDLDRIKRFAGDRLAEELKKASPEGPLQHLAGIQYYFDTEVRFWRGHTQYLDSAWGLTSIAQPQFWARQRDAADYYRSILSVDIGIWDRPCTIGEQPERGPDQPRDAWSLPPDEIARFTWAQIQDHHDDAYRARYGDRAPFPRPAAYALDQMIDCKQDSKHNKAPYLVNEAGRYPLRPGELSKGKRSESKRPKSQSSYRLIGNVVLAGTYMKTFTRITSMESANESARHAVNAILDDACVACDRCDIWDPEDHELEDLTWLKELDRELLGRDAPHFIDILGWTELPSLLPPRELLAALIRNRT